MSRWLIWLLIGIALCACQTRGNSALGDCPDALGPCDEAGKERSPRFAAPVVALAATKPLWPGCPSTLQVMAPLHRIVFHAVRPQEQPDTSPDNPSDWVCEAPEAPLLRAGLHSQGQLAVAR
jgi:hypothetical protein